MFSSLKDAKTCAQQESIKTDSLFLSDRNQKGISANYDALPPVC